MDRSCARAGGPQPHNPAAIGIHRTGTAEASAPRPEGLRPAGLTRLDRHAWTNLGTAGLAWFFVCAIAFTAYNVVFVPLHKEILANDLTLVYIGARVGLEHGWNNLYSLTLQHELFVRLRPDQVFHTGEWFISPPPYAWLIAPLVPLGPEAITYVWLGLLLGALLAAWWIAAPDAGARKALWLLGALAWYPLVYSVGLVQPDLILVLIVAAAWWLSRARRPYAAGAVLGLAVIKPQLALVLPLVLLAAGRWRLVAACAAVAVVFAALSLLAIGPQGLSDYRHLLSLEQAVPNNRYFTLAYPFGAGAMGYAAAAAVAAIAVVAAFLNRSADDDRIFSLGLLATALSATYWHLQDYTILVLAAWLFWRTRPAPWQRAWLLVVAVTAEFAWGFTPLPLLIAAVVWFAFTAMPARRTSEAARV